MAASLTYASLVSDILAYQERSDAQLTSQLPRCIMLAENKVITELKLLGFQTVVTGQMQANQPTLPKPVYWRETISLNLTNSIGQRLQILPRSLEYCRNYWPNPSVSDLPRFYADYNFDNFLIVATPNAAYNFELVYFARLTPLDDSHQTNWLTVNAPALLFYAAMLEVQIFLKNQAGVATWQASYDRAMEAYNGENKERVNDRSTKNG